MIKFIAPILRFEKKGEKTSWTYFEITAKQANQLKPGSKVSFRVKGKLDNHPISGVALLPMGDGKFIIPLKADLRKKIGKERGDKLSVALSLDTKPQRLNNDLTACLKAEPASWQQFKSMPLSHQRYFSKWIESAKTIETKTKRITMTVVAMANKMDYGAMLRAYRDDKL